MAPTGKTGVRSIQRITRGIPHNGAAKSPRYNTYQAQLMGCEGSGIEWLVEEIRAQQTGNFDVGTEVRKPVRQDGRVLVYAVT